MKTFLYPRWVENKAKICQAACAAVSKMPRIVLCCVCFFFCFFFFVLKWKFSRAWICMLILMKGLQLTIPVSSSAVSLNSRLKPGSLGGLSSHHGAEPSSVCSGEAGKSKENLHEILKVHWFFSRFYNVCFFIIEVYFFYMYLDGLPFQVSRDQFLTVQISSWSLYTLKEKQQRLVHHKRVCFSSLKLHVYQFKAWVMQYVDAFLPSILNQTFKDYL